MVHLRSWVRVATLAVATGVLAGACSGSAPAPSFDGEVVLGVAVPTSGDLSDFGLTIAQGAQLAADRQNAAGGLLGRKVVVRVVDDKASATTAPDAAQELVGAGAKAVVGHFNSGASIAAAPVYARAGILQITPTSTNPRLTQLGIGTVFRVTATDAAQGPALAAAILRDGHRSPAIVYAAGNTYAEGLSQSLAGALDHAGAGVVTMQPFGSGVRDYSPMLSAAREAGADSLAVVAEAPQAAEVLLQARDLGLGLAVYGGDSLAKLELVYRAGRAAEGATITSLLPNLVTGPDRDDALVDAYRAAFGRNPGLDTPAGKVAAETWFRAVEQAGTFDATDVAAALKEGFEWDSPIGPISYDRSGDLRTQTIHTNVVEAGQFVAKTG
ncbi:MAG: branched-chain amino acid ABC transporter substrate-binding protein [Acidimicrobiia bacterium]